MYAISCDRFKLLPTTEQLKEAKKHVHSRAVAIGMIGLVSTRPLFEATTTSLPIFMNLAARPRDRLAAMWPQVIELEINGFK